MAAIEAKTRQGILPKKVMIMAGGTGGHVMPALAVAHYLQDQGAEIHWMGTLAGIEARVVPQAGFPISFINIQGLRRQKWSMWLAAPWLMIKAILQSFRILLREKPDVVLSMGGYVSGPGAMAAWILRKPVILHEQNAIFGWTNRLLARFAKRIMVAFPQAFVGAAFDKKIIFCGNPVRETILKAPSPEVRAKENQSRQEVRLLILGGSQGASILNELVPKALAKLPISKRPVVWHQTGKNHLEKTEKYYQEQGIVARVTDFIQNMAEAYVWADIVVCRSGALTIAELSAVGVASILIPFPYATDDHQTANAKYLSDMEGAILLPQSALTADSLNQLLLELIDKPDKRLAIAKACRQLAKPLATTVVAEHCLEVSSG